MGLQSWLFYFFVIVSNHVGRELFVSRADFDFSRQHIAWSVMWIYNLPLVHYSVNPIYELLHDTFERRGRNYEIWIVCLILERRSCLSHQYRALFTQCKINCSHKYLMNILTAPFLLINNLSDLWLSKRWNLCWRE